MNLQAISPTTTTHHSAASASSSPHSMTSSRNSQQQGILFGYHIYDLSAGIATRFAPSLIGETLPNGVLHAAVVIFGHEYFFEGGISKRPAGCTRFGKNFSFVPAPLPATGVSSESEFDVWVRAVESILFGPAGYRLVDNNCIHFCEAATLFLTQGKSSAPDIIVKNISGVMSNSVGRFLADIAQTLSLTAMLQPLEQLMTRRDCRLGQFEIFQLLEDEHKKLVASAAKKSSSSSSSTKNVKDEKVQTLLFPLHCFGISSSSSAKSSSKSSSNVTSNNNNNSETFIDELISHTNEMITFAFLSRLWERRIRKERLRSFFDLSSSTSSSASSTSNSSSPLNSSSSIISSDTVTGIMTATEASTLVTSLTQVLQSKEHTDSFQQLEIWFSIFTQFSLHETFVLAVVHDRALKMILTRMIKHFYSAMPSSLKIRVLEVFSNLLVIPLASEIFTRDPKIASTIVFFVSRSLLDYDSWVCVHRASCLLMNVCYGCITLNVRAFESEVLSKGASHAVFRMLGPALFVISHVLPKINLVKKHPNLYSTPSLSAASIATAASPPRMQAKVVGEHFKHHLRGNSNSSGNINVLMGNIINHGDGNNNNKNNNNNNEIPNPEDIIEISEFIMENILKVVVLIASSGQTCQSILHNCTMTPIPENLKPKVRSENLVLQGLLNDLSMLL